MLSRLRHRLLALRLFWVAMLLLGAVFKPAIVFACESHEALHLLATGHGHEDDAHENGMPADETLPDGEFAPWMSLLHQGHCCVHGAAIVEAALAPDPVIATERPDVALVVQLLDARRKPGLRPPIGA